MLEDAIAMGTVYAVGMVATKVGKMMHQRDRDRQLGKVESFTGDWLISEKPQLSQVDGQAQTPEAPEAATIVSDQTPQL